MILVGRKFTAAKSVVLSFAIGLMVSPAGAEPLGTSFTYQGQLKLVDVPVNDICDMRLTLWDDPAVGNQVGLTLTFDGNVGNGPSVGVINGLFQVELDFGGDAFAGDTRWLQVGVCCSSPCSPAFTSLVPRQPLNATPYALHTRGITSNETGYIGIGTNSPTYPLEVHTSTASKAIQGSIGSGNLQAIGPEGGPTVAGTRPTAVEGVNSEVGGVGVSGDTLATTGDARGVLGRTSADAGVGVLGRAFHPTGNTFGVFGETDSADGIGVVGENRHGAGPSIGVEGRSQGFEGIGVRGHATDLNSRAVGVEGTSEGTDGIGVIGVVTSTSGIGVGVQGESDSMDGTGVVGTAPTKGVIGETTSTTDFAVGVIGRTASPFGIGVLGEHQADSGVEPGVIGNTNSTTEDASGVAGEALALTGKTYGGDFVSFSPDGIGVRGVHIASTGTMPGVAGFTNSNVEDAAGVFGEASSDTGLTFGGKFVTNSPDGIGAFGRHSAETGFEPGVYGQTNSITDDAVAIEGRAIGVSGFTFGGEFATESPDGTGVLGDAESASGQTIGVWGRADSTSGVGVFGDSTATTGQVFGVIGTTVSPDGIGVYGYQGASTSTGNSAGVTGETDSTDFHASGVFGKCNGPNGIGVHGHGGDTGVSGSGINIGVYGHTENPSGTGVWSAGNCFIDGDLTVNFGNARVSQSLVVDSNITCGSLEVGGAKNFKIDHPLDPANKYLAHYCTEGPEPLLMYRGNATLDTKGEAWVELPNYFEEINRDFQYQLTCIGSFAPVYVAQKVQGNRFQIAGGKSGSEISWTVTGVRNDPYMRKYGILAERAKSQQDRGKYLQPELYGKPKEMGVHYKALPLDYESRANLRGREIQVDANATNVTPGDMIDVSTTDVATLAPRNPMASNISASKIKTLIARKLIESRQGRRVHRRLDVDAVSELQLPEVQIPEAGIPKEGAQ